MGMGIKYWGGYKHFGMWEPDLGHQPQIVLRPPLAVNPPSSKPRPRRIGMRSEKIKPRHPKLDPEKNPRAKRAEKNRVFLALCKGKSLKIDHFRDPKICQI